MRTKVYLVGDNFLANEALQIVLKNKGYEVFIGTVQSSVQNARLSEVKPDIIIWSEKIVETREKSLFDLWKFNEITFRSIFILSARTIRMLGMGLTYGIEGYVHKKGGLEDLEKCIQHVLKGSVFISPMLSGSVDVDHGNGQNGNSYAHLTDQEEKILRYVYREMTSKEIANLLNISYKTVQNHRQNMCYKLGLKGRNKLYEFSQLYFD